jgi:hypothetical protein
MRRTLAPALAFACLLFAASAGAAHAAARVETTTVTDPATGRVTTTETAFDPATGQTSVTETVTATFVEDVGGERAIGVAEPLAVKAVARFGPFAVLDASHAALVRETDGGSPEQFAAMMALYPGIRTLEMADCPGTLDDTANLRLGRMIRARGLDTEVPAGGSVRSGAVELFLAGAHRRVAGDAVFDVHSWRDSDGRQARDFTASDPVNRAYLAYYRAMGLAPDRAASFYALTNSVSNDKALALHKADLAQYAALD